MELHNLPLDQILEGDCVDLLGDFPPSSIDMIFADPPYFLQLRQDLWRPNQTKVSGVDDEWDQFQNFADYDQFSRRWLKACQRVLKENATIWVIGTYHNIFRLGSIMQDLGFWFLNDVIWIKTNPMPNFRGVRFTNAHEILIWAAKNKGSKYTFNYHTMKALNDGIQMRSNWNLPICSGPERIKVNGKKGHSTQKPEALLWRIIKASTNPDDVILDPFFGTGTTGAVAQKLGRHWIGLERDSDYIKMALKRIGQIDPDNNEQISSHPKDIQRKNARVSFVSLVNSGWLLPGQKLYFRRNMDLVAEINSDGSITLNGQTGSIHKIARQQTNGKPCNGWENWFYENISKELCNIDALRKLFSRENHPQ